MKGYAVVELSSVFLSPEALLPNKSLLLTVMRVTLYAGNQSPCHAATVEFHRWVAKKK